MDVVVVDDAVKVDVLARLDDGAALEDEETAAAAD